MLTIRYQIKINENKKFIPSRMIHTKVTVVICKLEMLNSRGDSGAASVGGATDRNMIWVGNGRDRSLPKLPHFQNHQGHIIMKFAGQIFGGFKNAV